MTVGEMIAAHHRDDAFWQWRSQQEAWAKTPLGRAFIRYENAAGSAWRLDSSDYPSDRQLKKAWEFHDRCRDELLSLMRAGR
jgi:hypothetical protein